MSLLRLAGVRKSRGLGRHRAEILRGIDLALAPGELALVQGPSGAGKTTLLAVAAGILAADAGEVVVDEQALHALDEGARRTWRARRVGFVFQRANLLPALTGRENVLLGAALARLPAREAAAETDRLLAALEMSAAAGRRPAQLSTGEEQRIALARALVHRPAFVLADEPTANLDGATGAAVAELLVTHARQRGAAVLIATHDSRLDRLADRVLRIRDGRVEV